MMQRRLAWHLHKNDTKIHEAFQKNKNKLVILRLTITLVSFPMDSVIHIQQNDFYNLKKMDHRCKTY